MRKRLQLTLLALAVATCFTSCLKDEVKSTIIYSSQEIPDINKYMPHRLLELMGSSRLHYGDEPPRFYKAPFELGHYSITDLKYYQVNYAVDSIQHTPFEGNLAGDFDFTFSDQIKGIITTRYSSTSILGNSHFDAISCFDTTYHYLKNNLNPITNSPDCPPYFTNSDFDKTVFKNAYMIGSDSRFTIYYYDVVVKDFADNWVYGRNDFYPVAANIISGKLVPLEESVPDPNDTTKMTTITKYRIDDFCWGKELMGYLKDDHPLFPQFLSSGKLTFPGDVYTINNSGQSIFPLDD